MSRDDNIPPAKPRDRAPEPSRCPICGRRREPRYDPFCSRRCADVDLHRWLKGGYVIPGGSAPPRESEDED